MSFKSKQQESIASKCVKRKCCKMNTNMDMNANTNTTKTNTNTNAEAKTNYPQWPKPLIASAPVSCLVLNHPFSFSTRPVVLELIQSCL